MHEEIEEETIEKRRKKAQESKMGEKIGDLERKVEMRGINFKTSSSWMKLELQ